MTKLRTWAVVALAAVLAIIAGGWFLALSPQKSKVTDLKSQTAQQDEANQKLQSQITLLKKQQSQIPAEQARIAEIKGRIPDSPQVTAYVRTLSALAAATNVELVSIAPAPPTAVQLAAVAAPVAVPATTPGNASGKAAGATGAAVPAAPAVAPQNLSVITVSLNVVGDYYSVQQFLSKLEDTKRVTIVSSVGLAPGALPQAQGGGSGGTAAAGSADAEKWRTLSASITLSIFMSAAPVTAPAAAPGVATPAQQAPATTPNTSPASAPATASANN